jgi:rod shape-determining protein MreB
MMQETHENIKTIRPLKDGVIDFDASEKMISMFIKEHTRIKKENVYSRFMVVCIPSGITEVEMRAVKESCERVNGKEVYLIHEPMPLLELDIMQPKGNMIVDIGGTTEIAVIAWECM